MHRILALCHAPVEDKDGSFAVDGHVPAHLDQPLVPVMLSTARRTLSYTQSQPQNPPAYPPSPTHCLTYTLPFHARFTLSVSAAAYAKKALTISEALGGDAGAADSFDRLSPGQSAHSHSMARHRGRKGGK